MLAQPSDLTGPGEVVEIGHVRQDVLVYAPTDSRVAEVTLDGELVEATTHTHAGLEVAEVPVTLGPGESRTLEYEIAVGAGLEGEVALRTTPGVLADARPECGSR